MRLVNVQQFEKTRTVACKHWLGLEQVFTVDCEGESGAACLRDQAEACHAIPRPHARLIISDQTTRGDIGKHECARAIADEVAAARQHIGDDGAHTLRRDVGVGADARERILQVPLRVERQENPIQRCA